MKSPRLSVLLALGLTLLVMGCEKDNSPLGVSALPNTDSLKVLVFDSRDSVITITNRSYHYPVTASSSPYLSVGMSGDYTCYSLMRWINLPYDVGAGGRIVGATLTLRTQKHGLGDPSRPLRFEVREMLRTWSVYTITGDSIASLPSRMSEPRGRFEGVVPDSGSVVVELDTAMVRTWLVKTANGDRYGVNGIVLDPRNGSGVIRTFMSGENAVGPKLTLYVERNGDLDTLDAGTPEDTFIAAGPSPTGTDLEVHSGLAIRSRLVFDVGMVPYGSVVNGVDIWVRKDPSRTEVHYRGQDSLRVYEALSTTSDSVISNTNTAYSVPTDRPYWYRISGPAVVRAVQNWVDRPASNYGLMLQKVGESSDLDRFTYFGAGSVDSLRPRIVITYTRKPR